MTSFPDGHALLTELQDALSHYQREDSDYQDARIADALIVGSAITDDFIPYESDLDLIVVLANSPHEPVALGFDTFLREDYQHHLVAAAGMPISTVDVGVYSADNYKDRIDDETVYSCTFCTFTQLSVHSV